MKWAIYRTSDGVVTDVVVNSAKPDAGAGESVENIRGLAHVGPGWVRKGVRDYEDESGTPHDQQYTRREFISGYDLRLLFTWQETQDWDERTQSANAKFDSRVLSAEIDLARLLGSNDGRLPLDEPRLLNYLDLRQNLGNITAARKAEVKRGTRMR